MSYLSPRRSRKRIWLTTSWSAWPYPPGKLWRQIYLEAIPNHVRDMKVVGTDKNKLLLLSSHHCPWWSQYKARHAVGSVWGMKSFRFPGEGFHIFIQSDCVYGHNILVAVICLSAMRLLLYFLHSMLSRGASFLMWSREGLRLLTVGFIPVTSVFPCKGHKSIYKIFYFCKHSKAVT